MQQVRTALGHTLLTLDVTVITKGYIGGENLWRSEKLT